MIVKAPHCAQRAQNWDFGHLTKRSLKLEFGDLMFDELLSTIGKKSIVLLGESAHGVKEQNSIRIDLIKKLHEELGFNYLFMESIPDKGGIKISSKEKLSDQIKSLLHPVYHTEEIMELFDFAQKRNISIEGFEIVGKQLEEYKKTKKDIGDKQSRTFRDKTMFENLLSVIETRLRGEKVIIWAHNAHLMKKTSAAAHRDKVLGEFIHEKFGDDSICIGQFTGEGDIEHLPGQKVSLKQLENSIEDFIVKNIEGIAVYPNLIDNIFHKKILTLCSGIDHDEIIPTEHFDSLILHKTGTAPIRL